MVGLSTTRRLAGVYVDNRRKVSMELCSSFGMSISGIAPFHRLWRKKRQQSDIHCILGYRALADRIPSQTQKPLGGLMR